MASKEELYVRFESGNYSRGKANILGGQADLLKVMKSLQNLKILSRHKNDLKFQLHELAESVLKSIDAIEEKLPTPSLPKSVHLNISSDEVLEVKKKQIDYSKRDAIDEELRTLNEKIRLLNSKK